MDWIEPQPAAALLPRPPCICRLINCPRPGPETKITPPHITMRFSTTLKPVKGKLVPTQRDFTIVENTSQIRSEIERKLVTLRRFLEKQLKQKVKYNEANNFEIDGVTSHLNIHQAFANYYQKYTICHHCHHDTKVPYKTEGLEFYKCLTCKILEAMM